jgi:hypothetical protein
VHGVERDDAVCKIDFLKKFLRRRNLVGFLVDFDMRQHKRAVGGEGAQNLPRLGVVEGVEAFLERLAVERQSANAGNGLVIIEIAGDLLQLVSGCVAILESDKGDFLADIGRMLSESWFIKRRLAKAITNDSINEIYDAIMASGAHGAKLCGAGGGGVFVALIPPEQRKQLEHAVAPLSVIPIDIDVDGTCLIYPSLKS